MAELWVGAGKSFARVSDAIAAAKSGDTIYVMAGTYANDFATISKDLKIVGVGGKAHFTATQQIGNGKGIFITRADVTFENVEFSGAKVKDKNGAGIRYESGDLVIKNAYFHDNQNGILAANNKSGTITIENSEFARNGAGDGQTHGIYINEIARLTVIDSYFHDTKVGHHIKSRAAFTEVRDSRLDDGSGNSSYSIDLPNGGGATIVGNMLIQGANAGNRYMLHYGGESSPKAGSVLIEGNTFINYRSSGGTAVYNQTSKTLEFKNNALVGVDQTAQGPLSVSGVVKGVLGSSGADALVGDGAANWLLGAAGADQLSGGAGDDKLMGGPGNDVLNGGAGVDVAFFVGKASDYRVSAANGEVRVEALRGTDGTDRLIGVEKLAFADGVVNAPAAGTPAASEPKPATNGAPTAANDAASTQQDKPVLIDVLANDRDPNGDALSLAGLVGAPSHGVASIANGKIAYTPKAGFTGSDSFTYRASDGKGGFDDGVVTVKVEPVASATPAPSPTQPADDPVVDGKTIVGKGGYENLYGSSKNDVIKGMGGGDALFGYAGDDRLEGGDGNDKLQGGDGRDLLLGGSGNDVLRGEKGADKLDGGSGNDTLYGGTGADQFVFGQGCGADVVADFQPAEGDQIDLQAFGLDGFGALKALCSQSAGAVEIDLPGSDSIKLLNKQLADLTSDHFLL